MNHLFDLNNTSLALREPQWHCHAAVKLVVAAAVTFNYCETVVIDHIKKYIYIYCALYASVSTYAHTWNTRILPPPHKTTLPRLLLHNGYHDLVHTSGADFIVLHARKHTARHTNPYHTGNESTGRRPFAAFNQLASPTVC